MPCLAISTPCRRKLGMPAPGIWKLVTTSVTARSVWSGRCPCPHRRCCDRTACAGSVGSDALQQLVGDRIVAGLAGVLVADAGGQLLERHVRDRPQDAHLAGGGGELVDAVAGGQLGE